MMNETRDTKETRVSSAAAQEIIEYTSRLADISGKLATRVHDRLISVMLPIRPQPFDEALVQQREYPPLFDELRSRLRNIEDALNCIDSAISRAEL